MTGMHHGPKRPVVSESERAVLDGFVEELNDFVRFSYGHKEVTEVATWVPARLVSHRLERLAELSHRSWKGDASWERIIDELAQGTGHA